MPKKKWTAAEVVHALRVAYGIAGNMMVADEWGMLTEVPLRIPKAMYADRPETFWTTNQRTIDILLVRNWSSGVGFRRIAVEVKVSRSDYRNETDEKRAPAEAAAHQTYYAAPAGLIDPFSLPRGWGLFEVYPDWEAAAAGPGWEAGQFRSPVRVRKRPVLREPCCDLDYLAAALMRRASRAEERMRRGEDDVAKVPVLEREIASLVGKLERRDSTVTKLRYRLSDMRSVLASLEGGQVCADCEHPIRFEIRLNAWTHLTGAQNKVCEAARTEANRLQREADTGSRYLRGWPDPVEPKSIREQRATEDETQAL